MCVGLIHIKTPTLQLTETSKLLLQYVLQHHIYQVTAVSNKICLHYSLQVQLFPPMQHLGYMESVVYYGFLVLLWLCKW